MGSERASTARILRWPPALLCVFLPTAAAAGTLQLRADQLPCRDRAEILARIEDQVAGLIGGEPDLELTIYPVATGRLALVLTEASATSRRELLFTPADCPVLPRMVTMLLRGWLERRWHPAPSAPPAPPAPVAEPPPPETARKPVIAEPSDLEERRQSTPPVLRVALLGGGFASPGARQASGAARATGEWDLARRAGVGIRVGFDASPDLPLIAGEIHAPLFSVALTGHWVAWTSRPSTVAVFAGPALDLLSVSSSGFAQDLAPRILNVSLVVGAQLHYELTRSLGAVVGTEVAVRAFQEQLRIRDTGQEIGLATARVMLLAGISWGLH